MTAPTNMVFFHNPLQRISEARSLSFIKYGFDENEFIVDPEYQRDYVWGKEEQQELLFSIAHGVPINSIAIITNPSVGIEPYIEIVDGKQRITTIYKFFNNEISYHCPYTNKDIFFKDLPKPEQRNLKSTVTIPVDNLSADLTLLQKFRYFYAVNFSGKAQSNEHRKFIVDKISELENAS
jgi:hypothetical protein